MNDPRAISVHTSRALYKTKEEKAALEARNVLLQYDEMTDLIKSDVGKPLILTPEKIKRFQWLAINDIYDCAGHFRSTPIYIGNSLHQPPDAADVEVLVDQMCEQVNSSPHESPIRTAAYLLWRLNWIHPFSGGNGRTARVVSYYALCVRIGTGLPGLFSIPEQITMNRPPYYKALDEADAECKEGKTDVSAMESLLEAMLANQLVSIHNAATSQPKDVP